MVVVAGCTSGGGPVVRVVDLVGVALVGQRSWTLRSRQSQFVEG